MGQAPLVFSNVIFDLVVEKVRSTFSRGFEKSKLPRFLNREDEKQLFPNKHYEQATTKVNVFFRNIYNSCNNPIKYYIPKNTPNDIASGMLMWAYCAVMQGIPKDVVIIYLNLISKAEKHPEFLEFIKNVSDRLKMAGLAGDSRLRLLIETSTLLGRGVLSADGTKDLKHRLGENPHEFKIDAGFVYDEVTNILGHIKEKPHWKPFEEHLLTRSVYAKTGSHHSDRYNNSPTPAENRKQYLTIVSKETILRATPRTQVRQALKLEHGKTRFIYNCDTTSYEYFDYLLRPIERAWRHPHVILNPGDLDDITLTDKISRFGFKAMLDYTDFNSQHSRVTILALLKAVMDWVPSEVRPVARWCFESWVNMFYHDTDWQSTLPSGHRATTFINTVLNYVYFRSVGVECDDILCCGDDSILLSNSPIDIEPFLQKGEFNRSKQSYGTRGEFLRKMYCGFHQYAYPTRAISSFVSGNWVSRTRKEETDSLSSFISGIDRIRARSGVSSIGNLFLSEMIEKYAFDTIQALAACSGRVAMPGFIPTDVPSFDISVSRVIKKTRAPWAPKSIAAGTADAVSTIPSSEVSSSERRIIAQNLNSNIFTQSTSVFASYELHPLSVINISQVTCLSSFTLRGCVSSTETPRWYEPYLPDHRQHRTSPASVCFMRTKNTSLAVALRAVAHTVPSLLATVVSTVD